MHRNDLPEASDPYISPHCIFFHQQNVIAVLAECNTHHQRTPFPSRLPKILQDLYEINLGLSLLVLGFLREWFFRNAVILDLYLCELPSRDLIREEDIELGKREV